MAGGFEDLEVDQKARILRKRVHQLVRQLPEYERHNLANQMRRAAVSVTNCIAEGHGSYSFKHNISYLDRARGSVYELQDDFNVCQDEAYFNPEHLDSIRQDAESLAKVINGYIRFLRHRATGTDPNRPT